MYTNKILKLAKKNLFLVSICRYKCINLEECQIQWKVLQDLRVVRILSSILSPSGYVFDIRIHNMHIILQLM